MSASLHDQDFYAWAQQQLACLRAGDFAAIDLEGLIDEVEDMSASQRRELHSRFLVLLQHLLKWQFQPGERSNSWKSTIVEQRGQLDILMAQSPSLRRLCGDAVLDVYLRSRRAAALETGLPLSAFPLDCPWTVEDVLSFDFFPGQAV